MADNHNQEKTYHEYLAKLILETFIPEKYKNLILSDRPDIRMGDSYGIEVTRALYPGFAQASGVFGHIARKNINQVDNRHLALLKDLGCRPLVNDEGIVFGYVPNEAIWINDGALKTAYQKKVKKYELAPLPTARNDLFIYSPMDDWLEEDLVKGFMCWVDDTGKCPFENVIVFEYSYLYTYHVKSKTFTTFALKEISPEIFEKCYIKAKKYALSNEE